MFLIDVDFDSRILHLRLLNWMKDNATTKDYGKLWKILAWPVAPRHKKKKLWKSTSIVQYKYFKTLQRYFKTSNSRMSSQFSHNSKFLWTDLTSASQHYRVVYKFVNYSTTYVVFISHTSSWNRDRGLRTLWCPHPTDSG